MGRLVWARRATMSVLLTIVLSATLAGSAGAINPYEPDQFGNRVFASGAGIRHSTPDDKQTISQPDDITYLAGHIFVGFQSGVGPQGQASATGNRDSTVVEFDLHGRPVAQWDVAGKCDGLTADPALDPQRHARTERQAGAHGPGLQRGGAVVGASLRR